MLQDLLGPVTREKKKTKEPTVAGGIPRLESYPAREEACADRILDGPASGEKGSKGGPY